MITMFVKIRWEEMNSLYDDTAGVEKGVKGVSINGKNHTTKPIGD